MSDSDRESEAVTAEIGTVYCKRLRIPLPVEEHAKCLYCFGKRDEIRTGDHAKFCDFDPKKDPIQFGFPDGGGWVEDS